MSEAALFASVIVPVRNGEHTLAACLESLLAQDYPADRREVIVVENASNDGTPSVLRHYADRVRVLHLDHASQGGARNAGLDAANGDVLAFTDADCVASPDWLRRMVEPLGPRSRTVVVGDVVAPPGSGEVVRFGDRVNDQRAALGFTPPYFSTANCAMAAGPLRDRQGFRAGLPSHGDVDLAYRLHAAGWRFEHRPAVVVHHRNPDSLRRLFALGFRHGRWSIPVMRIHGTHLRALGAPRWSWSPSTEIGRAALGVTRGPERREQLCRLVFCTGKGVGKLAGIARPRSDP